MPGLRGADGEGQPRGARADHADPLGPAGGAEAQQGLVPGPRVDQAGRRAAREGVVQARLVARDARVDGVRPAARGLDHEVRVREQGPGQGHHVGVPVRQDPLRGLRGVDPVHGDQRDPDLALEPARHPGEAAAGDDRGDRGDARLVPADAGVEQGGAGGLDRPGQCHDLLERGAAGDQVQHGEPVDEDEVRAGALADAADDLHGQAHPVRVAPSPLVGAVVGLGGDELVDEVALGAHDLHAVVAGLPGERGGAGEVLDGPLDLLRGELVRHHGADGGTQGARGHGVRGLGVAAGVQDLQGDPAALGVHGAGHQAVPGHLLGGAQESTPGPGGALGVRPHAARDDESHPAPHPLRVELREPLEPSGQLLETGVHRSHEHPVGQGGEAQVQGCEQARIGHGHLILLVSGTWSP